MNGSGQAIQLLIAQQANRTVGVGVAYEAGYSIAAIADALGVQIKTVINHLEKQVMEAGLVVDPQRLRAESALDTAVWVQVRQAFTELGSERLKPTFEALQEAISYDELRLARLIFWVEKGAGQ